MPASGVDMTTAPFANTVVREAGDEDDEDEDDEDVVVVVVVAVAVTVAPAVAAESRFGDSVVMISSSAEDCGDGAEAVADGEGRGAAMVAVMTGGAVDEDVDDEEEDGAL